MSSIISVELVMLVRKENIVFSASILFVLRYPFSGPFLRFKDIVKQSGRNIWFAAAASGYFMVNSKDILPDIRKHPFVQTRRYMLPMLFMAESWLVYSSILILLLLMLWFYRRYELKKIKRLSIFQNQNYAPGIVQDNNDLKSLLPKESDKMFNQCLTGMCHRRLCFFNVNGNLIHIEKDVNGELEPASVDLLYSKINAQKFCENFCPDKKKYVFPSNRFIPKQFVITNNILSEFPVYIPPFNEFSPSAELNHSDNVTYFFSIKPVIQLQETAVSPQDREFILKAAKTIEANYGDYRFSVSHLARDLNMSISQVNRKLNALTGQPAGHLISKFRLQQASEFLVQGTDSISDVCFSTGYNGLAYFSRAFKRKFGCTPSVYRQLMTKKSISVRK